ncbi:UNVERIFIED_ORG: hypothetical protein J2Y76_005576 [Pseudomonas reinekei]|nr:hypothetical protein [Pseudomonas reinekei]MDF9903832.1 hypothetical protein [Pseudomonas reinekei]
MPAMNENAVYLMERGAFIAGKPAPTGFASF